MKGMYNVETIVLTRYRKTPILSHGYLNVDVDNASPDLIAAVVALSTYQVGKRTIIRK